MCDGDLAAVIAIERASYPTPWTEAMFRAAMTPGPAWSLVVRKDNQVVGYMVFVVGGNVCDLLNIAVAPAVRRHGIGRFLLQSMIDQAKAQKVEVIWLDVRASNAEAQRLYQSFGFHAVGRRKNYYQQEGEDAIVMTLQL